MATTNFNYNQANDSDRLLLIQNNIQLGDIEVQFALDEGEFPDTWDFIARLYFERRGGPRQGIFLERQLYGEENTLVSAVQLTALAPITGSLSYRLLARFRSFIGDGILTVEFQD